MKKASMIVLLTVTFFALFPISFRLADHFFFAHPFRNDGFEPVLQVCSDHVEVRQLRELRDRSAEHLAAGCTFNVPPDRQRWVEQAVRALASPNPSKGTLWQVHINQVGDAEQQIELELVADGVQGMIYDVSAEKVTPLQSKLTGPLGAIYLLAINVCLWGVGCGVAWLFMRFASHQPRAAISQYQTFAPGLPTKNPCPPTVNKGLKK